MKYLKQYKLFETVLTKAELVDKIRYYSTYVHNYMEDVNKFTGHNLNFSFHYTYLEIRQIFEAAEMLDVESPDGFITAVCNEFIGWSEYFTDRSRWSKHEENLKSFIFDDNYETYDDLYKTNNRHTLYQQSTNQLLYVYVGRIIEQMISGTIWDIPDKRKSFTEEDKNFILDSLLDYDVDANYIKNASSRFETINCENGTVVKFPCINNRVRLEYDSDFMYRLQSYFNGALILDRGYYSENYKIYLPFYIS